MAILVGHMASISGLAGNVIDAGGDGEAFEWELDYQRKTYRVNRFGKQVERYTQGQGSGRVVLRFWVTDTTHPTLSTLLADPGTAGRENGRILTVTLYLDTDGTVGYDGKVVVERVVTAGDSVSGAPRVYEYHGRISGESSSDDWAVTT